jgi:hypothetical protein
MGSSSYEVTYGYNWHNATTPLPPPTTSTTRSFHLLVLLILSFGTLGTALNLAALSRRSRAHPSEQRQGQKVQACFDLLFYLVYFFLPLPVVHYRRVPSDVLCQATGFALHFVSTAQFSAITGLVFERYYRLRCLQRGDAASARKISPHWRLFFAAVVPLLLLHAALPILTGSYYGHYAPIPNSTACYATGGRGVLRHDLYGTATVLYFGGCFAFTLVSSYRSLRITRALLHPSSASSSATAGSVRVERSALKYSFTITLYFLVCWSAAGVHFLALPVASPRDWPIL